jgi:hypothetical protein
VRAIICFNLHQDLHRNSQGNAAQDLISLTLDSCVYSMLLPSAPLYTSHCLCTTRTQNPIYVNGTEREEKTLRMCFTSPIGWFRNSKWIKSAVARRRREKNVCDSSSLRSPSCRTFFRKRNDNSPPLVRRVSDPIYVVFRSNFNMHTRTLVHSPWRHFEAAHFCVFFENKIGETKNEKLTMNASTMKSCLQNISRGRP